MVTKNVYWDEDGIYHSAEHFYGLHKDEKPMNCGNGSKYFEIDTGTVYMFDAENKEWYPW